MSKVPTYPLSVPDLTTGRNLKTPTDIRKVPTSPTVPTIFRTGVFLSTTFIYIYRKRSGRSGRSVLPLYINGFFVPDLSPTSDRSEPFWSLT